MDTVIQSCANQHMLSKEVYTEKYSKKKKICHLIMKLEDIEVFCVQKYVFK